MLRPRFRSALPTVALLWIAASGHAEQPDALIGTSEQIATREAGPEALSAHEAGGEEIADHEQGSRSLDGMSVPAEALSDHRATSESLDGRVVDSERLTGMGHPVESSGEGLAAAERALQAARQAHARAQREHAPAAMGSAPAPSSSFGGGAHSQWMARLDVQRHRTRLAQANLDVTNARYADMLRRDYPRGAERQALIDQRTQAQSRLDSELALSRRLVEQARQAGVPESTLRLTSPY